MEVSELVKKTLALGLGAAALSIEKLKQLSDEMVARGEMSTEEATRFVDEVSQKAQQEKESLRQWMSEQVSKMVRQVGAAEAEHVERLEARIVALERRVAELSADVVIPTCPSTESEGAP